MSSHPREVVVRDRRYALPINKCQSLMGNGSSLIDELKDLEKLCSEFKDNDGELAKRKKDM